MQARQPETDASLIERQILRDAGLSVAIEEDESGLHLVGLVDSEEARQAAEDIARVVVPDREIVNDIEVEDIWPAELGDVTPLNAGADLQADGSLLAEEIEPSFVDQDLLTDPGSSSGPSTSLDDVVESGEAPYFPPTDPVIRVNDHADSEVLGGFSATADASIEVDRSADGTIGDEALADAIRRGLREDAATTDLSIDVEVVNGVAHLRGRVTDLEDAENAEAVARSVPGLLDVVDHTEVTEL